MLLLNTNTTQLVRVTVALYDAAPGYTYLQNFLGYASANGLTATVNALGDTVSTASFKSTVLANLGLTGNTIADSYITAQLAAGTAKGTIALNAVNALASYAGTDAALLAAKATFNADVARGEAYSTNSSNTTTTLSTLQAALAEAEATIALTTGIDTKTGGAGADVFDGTIADSASDGDNLNGGAGTDRLNARYTADGTHNPDLTSVEQVYVRLDGSTTADVTFDLENTDGVTLVVADRINAGATGTVTFDDVDLGTTLGVYKGNGSGDVTFTFTAAQVTGTADSASLSLLDADIGDVTISSIETLSVSGTVGSSTVDNLAASSVKSLSIDATEAVTITAGNFAEDATVTVTGAGAVTLGLEDAITVRASAATGAVTLTGIDETETYNIVTGSGNDSFSTLGTSLAAADTITAGSGTDRLIVNYNITDGILDGVTGIEEVEYQKQASQSVTADLSIDMDAFNSNSVSLYFTQVSSTAAFDDITVTNFVSGTTVTVQSKAVESTGVLTLTADTDSDATATVVLKATDSDGVDISSSSNDFNEIATLNVQALLASGVSMSTTAESTLYVGSGSDDLDTIVITGSGNLQLTAAETEVDLIDGSASTGRLTLGVAGSAANVTVKGGAAVDTITLSASTDVYVEAGAGNDTIAFGTTLTDNDIIDGGAGSNDTLTFTVAAYNDDIRISNIETVTVTDGAANGSNNTIDFNNASGVTTINLVALTSTAGAANLTTFDDVGASITTLILDATTATADDDVTLDLYADTSADTLTIRVDQDGTEFDGDVTADDPETVNLVFAYTTGGTAAAALATATFADATSVVITNTDNDGTATTYLAGNYLSIAKLDAKSGATIDLTGWNFDVGVDNTYTSTTTTTVADSASSTAVTAGDFGTVGLTLVGADAVTIKLEDGETAADSAFYIDLGATNAGIDTIEFVNNADDSTNDIGAVILKNFLAAGANSVTNRTKIDLSELGVSSLSDLNILDGAQAANSSNGSGDITWIFAADGEFAGFIALVGIDAGLVTADNFIFS